MQPTERAHPGGKPSQRQPPNELPQHGAVNFHRQVLKNPEQIYTEDAVGTKENLADPDKEATDEVVKGCLYAWASNICHLEDTKVKVEDLSERDIGHGLAQNTQELLSKILKCDAQEMQAGAYSKSQQHEGFTTEEFTVCGPLGDWRVCRKTYGDIDARDGRNTQYSQSPLAKRILAEAQEKVGPAPSEAQVKRVACRILAERRVGLPDGAAKDKWAELLSEAHENLYKHREDAAFQSTLNDELNGVTERPASLTPNLIDLVEKNLLKRRRNKNRFHQFLLDGEASNLCERVNGFDIVILRDRKHELICGVVTEAVQKLFPAETVDKMGTAAEAFAWRFPYKKPDKFRHPTSEAVHLAACPNKDVRSEDCQQPHFAVCGVEHYGVHHEVGRGRGFRGLCLKEFSSPNCLTLPETTAWKEEFPKLKGGVYGIAAKVSRLVLRALDPRLYEDYMEVRRHLPESLNITLATTGENPYGFMAQLIDTLTEGHKDWTDWEKGMAALTCFGSFSGGDLVLKELGVRIAFSSGSNCHLRGQGLHHLISSYEGNRHCLVLTNKESVRRTIGDLDQRLKEETDRAAELNAKDPQDWTDEECKLNKAYTGGKNSMLEYTWSLITDEVNKEKEEEIKEAALKREEAAKRKEADKPKEDRPEEPPNKKVKKTKRA